MKDDKYDGMDLLKGNSNGNTENLNKLREEFKSKYVQSKGWDILDLTTEQVNEIMNQKGYKCPGMICG